jgi:hypothetical protein
MTKKHATSRSKRNNKTKQRSYTRRRSRSRSYGNRRTGVKRGGMLHATKMAMVARLSPELRTLLYHEIIPLLTQYGHYVHSSKLDPSHKSMVIHGEKHFNSPFLPDKMYNHFKKSLNDAIKDGQDPVKTGEKLITLHGKVKQALEEEERQQDKENGGKSNPTSTFSPSLFSDVSPHSLQHKGDQGIKRVDISQFVHPRFLSPNKREPNPDSVTPAKPRPKGTIGGVEDEEDDDDDGGTAQVLFGVETPQSSPIRSPPPPSSSNPSGPENKEKELFSPVRKLHF